MQRAIAIAAVESPSTRRTNKVWLVTPAEIERSLARYDKCCAKFAELPRDLPWVVIEDGVWTGDLETVDWWGEWIDYLRAASAHGGFRVVCSSADVASIRRGCPAVRRDVG